MPDLPHGTVTLLFTDIEGSTRLWEVSPDAMAPALARHDDMLRELIGRHGGHVFKTIGDAFCAAFDAPERALAAAVEAQSALAHEPWSGPVIIKVRMALHTGAVEVRDRDYFGPALNRVARLLAAGHGGQILVSRGAAELLRDRLPEGVALRDLGERRLKDLIRPERVFEVAAPGLATDFAPLRTLDARAHNLPVQVTSFVGRGREMQAVKELLQSSRLVTLTGAGGTGKTRLALQLGAELIDEFADGAWFGELASLTEERLVVQAVANVLGVDEQAGVALADTVAEASRDKELLLLLDNCEHLIEASAQVCEALLARCAKVRILATSREPMRISGEATYRVPSLATPDPRSLRVDDLAQYDAVRLFMDRALAVKPTLEVGMPNARTIATICHRLDGIPLALELAAARLRSLSVDELDRRLDQRFRVLTGGSRTALPRHQTLRAMIDWSYDLLSTEEQALLSRSSAFAGGWTLDAAEHVCADEAVAADTVLDLLTALADKSLVSVEEVEGATRYRLLETVRQYAAERLDQSATREATSHRHLQYFMSLAEDAAPMLLGATQVEWLRRLDQEHDNLRTALEWSAGNARAGEGLRLCGALDRFWITHGHVSEGRSWCARLLGAAGASARTSARARVLNSAGLLAYHQTDYPAARALLEEGLAIRRDLGDRAGLAAALGNLGMVTEDQGDHDAARKLHEESLAMARELGNKNGVARSLGNLGIVASDQGDYTAARALHEESLAIFRELKDQGGIAVALHLLGEAVYEQVDYESARAYFLESLVVNNELGHKRRMVFTLERLGGILASLGSPLRAAPLWGLAEQLREELDAPLPPPDEAKYETSVADARAASGDGDAFDRARKEGRALSVSQAIEAAR